MKKLLMIALCALCAAATAHATTYYVNAGRPNNNGNGRSLRLAKKTIQAAVNLARDGDTILVYPGEYAPIKTNNKKITIKAVKGSAQTSIFKPAKQQNIALAQLGKTYWEIYSGRRYSSAPYTRGKSTTLTGFLLDGKNRDNDYYDLLAISGGTARSCSIRRLGSGSDYWVLGRTTPPSRSARSWATMPSSPIPPSSAAAKSRTTKRTAGTFPRSARVCWPTA